MSAHECEGVGQWCCGCNEHPEGKPWGWNWAEWERHNVAEHPYGRYERLAEACQCGHEKREHPYVGRIASWPTRCMYCDCKEFELLPRVGAPRESEEGQRNE